MSESDYQRGLRGGSCPVSISDWERWSDWKEGNREYERLLDEEIESNLAAVSTPKENIARINARIAASEVKEVASTQDSLPRRAAARQKADSDATSSLVLGFFLIFGGCAIIGTIVGAVAGLILKWTAGAPFTVTFVGTMVLATVIAVWRFQVESLQEYHDGKKKRAKEAAEDETWRRRYHPYPAGKSGAWTYCAVAKCWCVLLKRCNNHACTCDTEKICQTRSCDCTRIKVCPDPSCNCGYPKIATDEHCTAIPQHV